MNEKWKQLDFLGYPKYKISNKGKIDGPKGIRAIIHNQSGYQVVDLHNDIGSKQFMTHILVAQAFIPNPNNLPQVNHKDGNKDNCEDYNLEWVTAKQNIVHATHTGLRNYKGEGNPANKLTQEQVNYIRQHPKISQTILAKQFNIHPSTISKIRRKLLW